MKKIEVIVFSLFAAALLLGCLNTSAPDLDFKVLREGSSDWELVNVELVTWPLSENEGRSVAIQACDLYKMNTFKGRETACFKDCGDCWVFVDELFEDIEYGGKYRVAKVCVEAPLVACSHSD